MLGRSSEGRWDGRSVRRMGGGRGSRRREEGSSTWYRRDEVDAAAAYSVQGASIGPEAAAAAQDNTAVGSVRGTAGASPCRGDVWLERQRGSGGVAASETVAGGWRWGFFELGVGSWSCFIAAPLRLPRCCLSGHTSEMSRETDGRVWSVETVHHARAGWVKSARTPWSETTTFDAKH
jgi:hypothetical protein